MSGRRVLNPASRDLEHEAVALSGALLEAARSSDAQSDPGMLGDLSGQLHGVDPAGVPDDGSRAAFWINVYNALVTHALILSPARGSVWRQLGLFGRTAYAVGDATYTPNEIEHGLLRGNRRAPLHLRSPLRGTDPRLRVAPGSSDPRIHFALNCGARSCPPIRHYEADPLDEQLEIATRSYLSQETEVSPKGITLPGLMRLYRSDFGSKQEAARFAAERLDEVNDRLRKPGRVRINYNRFDWAAV